MPLHGEREWLTKGVDDITPAPLYGEEPIPFYEPFTIIIGDEELMLRLCGPFHKGYPLPENYLRELPAILKAQTSAWSLAYQVVRFSGMPMIVKLKPLGPS